MELQETELMNEIAKRSLARKSELSASLNVQKEVINSMLKNLIARGLVMSVTPVGETAYALTQKGIKSISQGQ